MRNLLLRYLFITLVFAGTCFASGGKEEYFALLMDGKKIGHGLQTRTVEDDLVTTNETVDMTISRFGLAINIKASETCVETPGGKPVSFEMIENFSGNIKKTTGKVTGAGKMEITSHAAGSAQKHTIEVSEDALMFEGMRLLEMEKGLKEGTKYKAKMFSPSMGSAMDSEIVIGPKASVDLFGRIVELTEVNISLQTSLGAIKTTTYVDQEFKPLKTIMPLMGINIEMIACDRQFALSKVDVFDFVDKMLTKSPVELDEQKARKSKSITYTLSPAGEESFEIPGSKNQKVKNLGEGKIEVTVKNEKAAKGIKFPYRGKEKEILKYLEPTPDIQSDHEKIIALSRKATTGAKDSAQAVHKIEQFVSDYISEKDLSVGYATALEVAISKQGDCTEHSVLTAALCRAAGIPARVACGIVYTDEFAGNKNVFVGHAWTECYIDGKWFGLDATLGTDGFDATHITLATGSGDPADFFSILTAMGRFKIDKIELAK